MSIKIYCVETSRHIEEWSYEWAPFFKDTMS